MVKVIDNVRYDFPAREIEQEMRNEMVKAKISDIADQLSRLRPDGSARIVFTGTVEPFRIKADLQGDCDDVTLEKIDAILRASGVGR